MSIFLKLMSAARGHGKPTRMRAPVDVVEPNHTIRTVAFDTTPINETITTDLKSNIKEIPEFDETNFHKIYDAALQSIMQGRNLEVLYTAIIELRLPSMTKKRASDISAILNNKATALINRERQVSLGIEYATWMYAGAPCMINPKNPTPAEREMDQAHKAADGTRYRVADGLVLNGRTTWPGRRTGCRCFSKAIVPGLT